MQQSAVLRCNGWGSVGDHEAASPEAIRRHASLADLAVDEIIVIFDTVIVRADPASV